MRFGAIWLAVVATFLVAPCYALDQRDIKNCDQSADWDRKIAGCTKLLTEPRFPPAALSTIYAARGSGWAAKNDFARAIVDFDESLRLNPKNLVALNNRYRMHTSLLQKSAETDSLVGIGLAEGDAMSMEVGLGRFGDRRLEKDAMGQAARQL